MSIRPVHLTRQLSVGQSGFDRTLTLKQRDLVRLQEQLATGKRVNRASDDASAFEVARRMENLGERYGQYQDAIMRSRGWVNQNQETLDQIAELLTMAYEKGIDAQDETHSPDDLAVVAESVDAYLEEIIDQLNTQVEGEYLFAGTDTLDTPFQAVDVAGTQVVNYLGNTGERTRAIGPGNNLDINITGDHELDTGQGFTIT
jgi:flagellar hook-associated protein 3 FlgL